VNTRSVPGGLLEFETGIFGGAGIRSRLSNNSWRRLVKLASGFGVLVDFSACELGK
jgi:hypothetical protein